MTVYVNDSNHFHQRYHNQTNCAGKGIEQFQPVLTGTCTEYQSNDKAKHANYSCNCMSVTMSYKYRHYGFKDTET